MGAKQFIQLSKEGEGFRVEYKTCVDWVSESLYETVCAFLNHSGGYILVGVRDNGEIIGINPHKAENLKANIITTIKNHELFLPCPYFTPQILEIEGKVVLFLEIPHGIYVYRYNGRYWDRNGDADIDVTNQSELLLNIFERKNPHLFEEKIVESLTIGHLDHNTFQFCRNILSVKKPEHIWLQLTDEEILIHTRLAKIDSASGKLRLKYAALILFGKEDAIEEFMPRYRFEALFHMCTYEEYNNIKQFPNRYDDRKTMRCNLISIYDQLSKFTERHLPDKFYLPTGTSQREDLRWNLFREIVANLCVHTDYSSGYACFYHIFKDRVITQNPTRLLPEIPEGKLNPQQLRNYTKNPLLVRVFLELAWAEDMGSGIRNILRYAPLYYPKYKVEINNASQFVFSITYMGMSPKSDKNVTENREMSPKLGKNVTENHEMSPKLGKNVTEKSEMSPKSGENVTKNIIDIDAEELKILLDGETLDKKSALKKRRRHQGMIGLIRQNPEISIKSMAEKLDVNERTIHRDVEELKNVIKHIGPHNGGHWVLLKNK